MDYMPGLKSGIQMYDNYSYILTEYMFIAVFFLRIGDSSMIFNKKYVYSQL